MYTFLKKIGDQENRVFAVKTSRIENIEIAECYDKHGQQIGEEVAGCTDEYTATGRGFDYHDGHNWQSVIVESDTDDWCTHEVITDSDVIAELTDLIENSEEVEDEYGIITYAGNENWEMIQSRFASSFAEYEFTEK